MVIANLKVISMQYRTLGRTGIKVSAISFGAGPVSGLMTGTDANAQRNVVVAAIEAGINWFDTAPGYGAGSSEANLGRALSEIAPAQPIHIATKVRIPLDSTESISDIIRRSVEESLQRLRVSSVSLLQLHNGVTSGRGDEPAAITPDDILSRGGVADTFDRLREEGLIQHTGLTGTGQPSAMKAVIRSGRFDTVQTPYNAAQSQRGCDIAGAIRRHRLRQHPGRLCGDADGCVRDSRVRCRCVARPNAEPLTRSRRRTFLSICISETPRGPNCFEPNSARESMTEFALQLALVAFGGEFRHHRLRLAEPRRRVIRRSSTLTRSVREGERSNRRLSCTEAREAFVLTDASG